MAGDEMVLATQRWLNQTYGAARGRAPLAEDGATGWETIYGLCRGLQTDLADAAAGFRMVPSFLQSHLLEVIYGAPLPTNDQAEICASAYAAFLASPHR